MPVNYGETTFERLVEEALLAQGYRKRAPGDYDRALCLDTGLVVSFVQATQPETWARYTRQYPTGAAKRLAQRLARAIEQKGASYTFHNELKDSGCHFRLAYFKPNTTLNPAEQQRYRGNIFSVVRQLRYRPESDVSQPEIDLTLFLNGIPIFTAELKNQFTGQNAADAIKQYQKDRPPTEPLLSPGRCLAHFAVDDQEVHVTPALYGDATQFLPFNQGHDHGKGNPPAAPSSGKFATSYLWDEIWSADSILNLVQRFIYAYDETDPNGKKTGTKHYIFPRFHQLTAVRDLVAHTRQHGPGQRYLIQHSAGSGKTMTISWLAHQLSVLHDDQDEPIFNTVVVVSDRRVLDRQLQTAVRNFEKTLGVVETIDQNSQQLREALETGKPIIVTTLQKFPVIAHRVGELPGKRFAVIVDEAHSSQSGSTTQALNRTLSTSDLDEAEQAESGEPEDMEDILVEEMTLRRHLPNVSTFAFTATPKAKTLQLFNTPGKDGKPPFSLYPMRQAIEEDFILDVLQNYTTYKAYWRLLKTITDDPQYDRRKAQRVLKTMVEISDHAIDEKVAIIVEHFAHNVAHRIAGQAKAMIVTRSRLHAVRYKLAVDTYLKAHAYPFKSLVAFSGTVEDGATSYTETGMNTTSAGVRIPESATAEEFKKTDYRLLIAANKFQTGFDQSLLHTMYVDKKLGGVNAVQTLSRLNRTHKPDKKETLVLDFVNEADAIQHAFQPYYEVTLLSEQTDPNILYQLQAELDDAHLYTEDEIDTFIRIYMQGRYTDLAPLYAHVDPVVDRVAQLAKDEQQTFRSNLNDFTRLYAFLAQIVPFLETEWEKRFHFYRFLLRRILQRLPDARGSLPLDIYHQADLAFYRVRETFDGVIELTQGTTNGIPPVGRGGHGGTAAEERDPLSIIIEELNKIYNIPTNGDAEAAVQHLRGKLQEDITLTKGAAANPPDTFRLLFEQRANEHFAEMIDAFFKFYKQVTDNPQAKNHFFDWLFEQYQLHKDP